VINCRSAVIAKDGGGVDGVVAGVAACDGRCAWGGSEDLGGDVHGLYCVVAADARGHDEGFEEANDGGDAGPEEKEIEDAEAVASQIEVVDAEVAEKDGEEDADDRVLAGALVFGVEPGALLVVHVCRVDGIDGVHGRSSCSSVGLYAGRPELVPGGITAGQSGRMRLDWPQFTRVLYAA